MTALIWTLIGVWVLIQGYRMYVKNDLDMLKRNYPFGRINDEKGMGLWAGKCFCFLGSMLVLFGLLLTVFPGESDVLMLLLAVIVAASVIIFIIGSKRYTL